ncbi:MAG: restriction endonuclease [Candidatus Sumerlaeia bacterium]|nr:restriction endonuclease [Candidatus Sumerlaeia bacterium]
MPVPPYDQFIEPVLRFLATQPDGALAKDVHEAAADALGLTAEDRAELVPSGAQPLYKNRAGWAHDRLKRNELSSSPRRGIWKLTEKGRSFMSAHAAPFSAEEVDLIASKGLTIRLSPARPTASVPAALPSAPPSHDTAVKTTPDEQISSAIEEIRETVAADLLDRLKAGSPAFFERVVLEVLHRMGYGAARKDLQAVGGVGDGGIDGIISLDKLGLEKVYVQAKRWNNPVGRPEVQGFYGALAGLRARKGVLITTSSFSAQALDFAKTAEGFVLVDGTRLTQLMIDHGVGVTLQPIQVPRLDSDFFDEE